MSFYFYKNFVLDLMYLEVFMYLWTLSVFFNIGFIRTVIVILLWCLTLILSVPLFHRIPTHLCNVAAMVQFQLTHRNYKHTQWNLIVLFQLTHRNYKHTQWNLIRTPFLYLLLQTGLPTC